MICGRKQAHNRAILTHVYLIYHGSKLPGVHVVNVHVLLQRNEIVSSHEWMYQAVSTQPAVISKQKAVSISIQWSAVSIKHSSVSSKQ
jgi:hypothetical protein